MTGQASMNIVSTERRFCASSWSLVCASLVLCVLAVSAPRAEAAPDEGSPSRAATGPNAGDSLRGKILAFVEPLYIHGVPYESAQRLGPEALPILEELLADPALKPQWTTLVAVTAFVDAPRSFDVLTHFLENRFRGDVDHQTFSALMNVLSVLGTVHDRRVGPYLIRGADKKTWSHLRWRPSNYTRGRLASLLAHLSLSGLSFSGTEEARVFLAKRLQGATDDWEKRNIPDLLERNEAIRREGLIEWTRRMNAGH